MAFTPFTVDLLSTPGTATIHGLIPSKQYQITAVAKNGIGTSDVSNTLTVTMAAQLGATNPSIVQSSRFRMNQDGSTSKVISLPSAPTAGNKIFVFVNAFGSNSDNGGITGPSSATILSGPWYDGTAASEVLYIFLIENDITNSYTFTGYDGTSNVGWKVVEVSNAATWDVSHSVATEAATGSTSISWPVVAPAFTNCVRLSNVSIQFAPATIGAATNCTLVQTDVFADTYHTGFLAKLNDATVTSPSVAITGAQGTGTDTPAQMSINIYGSTIPTAVQNVTKTASTPTSITVTWDALTPTPTAYIPTISGGAFGTFTRFEPPLSPSVQTFKFTGLSGGTPYQIQIYADSPSGEGAKSTALPVSTPSVQALTYIQSCLGTDQAATGTVTATFGSPTTPGNTLLYYVTMFAGGPAGTNNLTLGAQPSATATNVYGPATDGSGENIQLFYTVPTAASGITSVSYTGYQDRASLIVVEVQGVISVDAVTHSGALTFTDGVSGNVQVPITAATATPSIGLYFVHMTVPPDSWGTPSATGITKLQAQTGDSAANNTFHGAALFGEGITAGVHATAGAKAMPYTINTAGVVQSSPPNFVGVNLIGATQSTAPGKVGTLTFGTTTATSIVVNYPAVTGSTVTGYVTQYATSITGPFKSMNSTTALTVTAGGASDPNGPLTQGVTYYFVTTAYNGTTPGTPSDTQSHQTTATAGASKLVAVSGKLFTFGGKLAQTP